METSVEQDAPLQLSPGCKVRVVGLVARPELNGSMGRVLCWMEERDRWQVLVEGQQKPQLFKRTTIELVDDALPDVDKSGTGFLPQFRLANEDDVRNKPLVDALVQLVNDAYRTSVVGLVDDPDKFVRTDSDDIEERLSGIDGGMMKRYLILGFINDEVVACSSVTTGWRHPLRGQFGMLAVSPKFQRRGIAGQLVKFAEKHCVALGMREMQCEEMTCVDGSHDTSNWMMKFYKQRLGYSVHEEYFFPKGRNTRGARTSRDLTFLVYRKQLGTENNTATAQKKPAWFK